MLRRRRLFSRTEVELHEEAAERATPIALPNGSLVTAVGAIVKDDAAAE